MNTIKRLACTCACFVLLAHNFGHADGWRSMVPLHSSAGDETRMLGIRTGQTGQQPINSGHGSMKVDEYGLTTTKEEHRRLDDFATELRVRPTTQGYIIAYAGRRARPNEAKNRAQLAKAYLVKQRGIKNIRLVTLDGGYREEPGVELFIRFENGDPPRAFPTVDPSKVEIIKDKQPSKRRSSSKMRPNKAGHPWRVRLQKSERNDKLCFILKNETEHSIYVSYLPPDQGNTTTEFLAYGLERKTAAGDFKPYGEGFHFIPSLAPLAPKSAVEFALIHPPQETGEYRVIVGYSEDEAVVRLMRQKGSNLTDSEKKEVDSQQRVVRSDTFAVR